MSDNIDAFYNIDVVVVIDNTNDVENYAIIPIPDMLPIIYKSFNLREAIVINHKV